ncbi:MAG: GIY-YIG nuclease family protein [Clostridia bacterium]
MESEERIEYKRRWYQENKDKVDKRNKEWREKNKDNQQFKKKQNENSKKQREKNPEYLKEYSKTYYNLNKEKWVEYRNKDSFNCVYFLVNKNNEITRCGSTNNLKNRMVQYFNGNVIKGWGVYKWFHDMELDKVIFIELDTREKAYALESLMIEKWNPILNQNEIRTDYWDKYIDNLGDIENIEELFQEFDISRYEKIYEGLL